MDPLDCQLIIYLFQILESFYVYKQLPTSYTSQQIAKCYLQYSQNNPQCRILTKIDEIIGPLMIHHKYSFELISQQLLIRKMGFKLMVFFLD